MAFNPFPAQVSPVEITDLPEKVSPVGNDEIQIVDSENSNAAKKIKISSLPSGSGGGGATSLDQLTDVTATSPANGQALVYNNSSLQWEPQTISSNLDSLTDVVITSPVSTQVLKYSGVSWANGTLTKSNVGLASVDNTSDLSKPVSSATQAALDLKYNTSNPSSYVDAAGASAAAPVQSVASRTGVVVLTKSDVGLSNVDNTSDANKPVSTATQTALNTAINSKQDTLVSSTNIKTVNGSSILGSGDLIITADAYSVALISALNIDWSSAGILYKDISINSAFTFSNVSEGKALSVILTNISASPVIVIFPTGIYKELGTISIAAGSATIFSFVRANSKTYLASLKDLTNA